MLLSGSRKRKASWAPEGYVDAGARYYDASEGRMRGDSGDISFYLELARASGGPVLELGCGSGRVLLPIAREGIPVTGLDVSPEMLDELRRKDPPSNLDVVECGMESFDFGSRRFRLIFSGFRAIQHLEKVEDQVACVERAYRHLEPGGVFAFDVSAPWLPGIARAQWDDAERVRFTDGPERVVRRASVRIDHVAQVVEIFFRYDRRRRGRPLEPRFARFRQRYFFRYELEHLLARAGFEGSEFFGGFDRRPYDYVSGETVVLTRRSADGAPSTRG